MNGGWELDKLVFDERGQQVDMHVSSSSDTPVCPVTGEHGTLYYHRKAHSRRYLDWLRAQWIYTLPDSTRKSKK